jgi:hypothetical protein
MGHCPVCKSPLNRSALRMTPCPDAEWLAAEPEATPQTLRLQPCAFRAAGGLQSRSLSRVSGRQGPLRGCEFFDKYIPSHQNTVPRNSSCSKQFRVGLLRLPGVQMTKNSQPLHGPIRVVRPADPYFLGFPAASPTPPFLPILRYEGSLWITARLRGPLLLEHT